jgi:FkbM family methyltransferase
MQKFFKPIYRGPLSLFKPIRELTYQLFKNSLTGKFLIVKRRDCNCYMLVDTSDTYGTDVLRSGKIETPEDEFIKKLAKPNMVIVDIGAHWGGFSLLFGKLMEGKGKVISFEASKRNFNILRKNICINRLTDIVKPFHFAVGDKETLLKFPLAATSSGHNSLIRKDLPIKGYEEVKQIKLDDFLPDLGIEKIDFLKIDIEGYEYFALKGAEKLIKNSPNLWLFIEYSPKFMDEETFEKLTEFLRENFNKVFLAYGGKIFESDWKEIIEISKRYGQRNLFLYKS